MRSLSKDVLVYGLGNASTSVVSFLLLPLYTRFLTPEDYGILAVFTVYQSVLEITLAFGLGSGVFRYFLLADGPEERRTVLGTCFTIQAGLLLVLGPLLFAAAKPLSQALFRTEALAGQLNLVTASVLLGALPTLYYALMRAERRTTLFAGVQFGRTLVLAVSNILLITVFKLNYMGVILTNLIVSALLALGLSPLFLKRFLAPLSGPLLRRVLRFVGPVYLANGLALVLASSDRFFLSRFLTTDQVGLYSFGGKIGSAITVLLITPFSTAVVPYALSIAKREDFPAVYAAIIRYFTIVATLASLAIFYFSKEIVAVVGGEAYMEAWGIIGPTVLSGVLFGLYYALSIPLDILEKTHLSSVTVGAGAALNVVLNLALIPRLGMYGAAVAACCANGLLVAVMYAFCQRGYPHDAGAFLKLGALVSLAVAIFFWAESTLASGAPRIAAKLAFLAILPAAMVMTGIVHASEWGAVKRRLAPPGTGGAA